MLSIAQFCFYYIFYLPFRIWFRPKIGGLEYIPQRPFIIVANHTSKVDPFLLCLLPFSEAKRLIPIYFLTTEHYYRRWYLRPILKLLGCYPVARRAWSLHDFLSTTIEKVESGKIVMFFPEGKIVRKSEEKKPRPGIGYLVKQTQKPILPLHIEWDHSNRPILTFGRLIIPSKDGAEITFEEVAKKIMEVIYSL
ncbi:MAG: 1-acyl-sn-glycerol-3-phosphate acyltransferase [Candidatus Zambryskibacteria bacterium]|nr:1-acyl-sn-glycerol-3-phosphate acyltransferase [Candidatus Zambryskibacteria bacterium]